jgi:hypothetical protein
MTGMFHSPDPFAAAMRRAPALRFPARHASFHDRKSSGSIKILAKMMQWHRQEATHCDTICNEPGGQSVKISRKPLHIVSFWPQLDILLMSLFIPNRSRMDIRKGACLP